MMKKIAKRMNSVRGRRRALRGFLKARTRDGEKKETARGFTIVETILVLGVGSLIFLAVFMAFPAVRRAQQDAAAKEDVSFMLTKLQSYADNNRGTLPTVTATYPANATTYLGVVTHTAGSDTATASTDGIPGWAKFYSRYLLDDEKSFAAPNGNEWILQIVNFTNDKTLHWRLNDNEKRVGTMWVILHGICDGETITYTNDAGKVAIETALESGGVYCQNN